MGEVSPLRQRLDETATIEGCSMKDLTGHSSSGKSHTTETTVRFFPREAVLEMTAMSEKALVYSKEVSP